MYTIICAMNVQIYLCIFSFALEIILELDYYYMSMHVLYLVYDWRLFDILVSFELCETIQIVVPSRIPNPSRKARGKT
jgi:hypothetical protein